MLASSVSGERKSVPPNSLAESFHSAFHRALWQGTQGMYLLDATGLDFRYQSFNSALRSALEGDRSILGNGPLSDIVNQRVSDCLAPDAADWANQHYRRCVRSRDNITFEENLEGCCWQLVVHPLVDMVGDVNQLLVIATDITDRQEGAATAQDTHRVWQQVIDSLPSAIFWKDRESRYLGCNQGFLDIAGTGSVAEMIGKNDYEMVWKKEESDWFIACDRRVMDADAPELNIVEPQLQSGGRQAWLRTDKVPLHNQTGEVIGVLGVIEDITDRKEVEDKQARLLAILEATPDIIGITDALGNHHYLNRAGQETFSISPADTKLFHLSDITHPDMASKLTTEALPTAMEKGIWHGESLIRDYQGRDIPVSQVLICHKAEDGAVAYFSSIMRDISDRKEAEAILKETAERQAVLNSITSQVRNSLDIDTVIGTTLIAIHQGLKLDYSGFAWIHLKENDEDEMRWEIVQALDESDRAIAYGESPLDLLGPDLNQLAQLVVSQVDDVDCCEDSAHRDFLDCMGIKAEILVPFRADELRIGVIIGQHVHQTHAWNEEEVELLAAVTDQLAIAISQADLYAQSCRQSQEVAQTLEQLQKTQAQIIQAEKMSSLGQMVAGVAHEINNPVNFIHGNIEPAQDYITDLLGIIELYCKTYPETTPEIQAELEAVDLEFVQADLPKLLESMAVGTDRIREIVLSLRNFSRLDEAAAKTVDLNDGINSTLVILSHRLKGNAKNRIIEVEKQYGDMPKVDCYPSQLNQVFMNILANAVDALDEHEEPKITVLTEQQGDRAIIRIADNGSGIPLEIQPQILDPFFTTKPVGKGTGMGMSISYQIVTEKHGGSLSFTSEVGKGTEFIIAIPLHQPEVT